jgi:hypothetical protein
MNEHNDKSEQEAGEGQDAKRWTAKRRAVLVVELLSGQTTIAQAAPPRSQGQRHRAVEGHLPDQRQERASLQPS